MARPDKMGAITISARYPRWWEAVVTVVFAGVVAFQPGNALPIFQHIPTAAWYLVSAAILIVGCCRAWRMGLRLDDQGLTVRNFYRTYRFAWTEVRCFADGSVNRGANGHDKFHWALKVVLHDERAITARGATSRKMDGRPETLTAIQQAAERYTIPGTLTGEPNGLGSPTTTGLAAARDSVASSGDDRGEGAVPGSLFKRFSLKKYSPTAAR